MKIYYGKATATAWAATSSQSGYPPSNVSLESIGRPWRGGDAGTIDVTIYFSSAVTIYALLLQDVNFASATIKYSTDGSSFNTAGTITTYADKLTGRRRGLYVLNQASLLAVRVSIASGTPTDGLTYWRIGAAYPFTSVEAIARMPEWGVAPRAIFPKVSTDLPNGKTAQAATGPDVLTFTLPYLRAYDQDVPTIVRRARAGPIGLAIEIANYDEFTVPVTHVVDGLGESLTQLNRSELSLELKEIT